MAESLEEDDVSADLSSFVNMEEDERGVWKRVEDDALALCGPLAAMIGHKHITYGLDVSAGQLTRELSPSYENRLSLGVALYILRRSQNEKLARVIVCDGAGLRLPEWQKRKVTPEEENRAFRRACRESGAAGAAIYEIAQRFARGGGK